ncbi:MAG TPA: hypothetical protein VM686_07630, partial [Polyangiaceae bacterium]|nr:hypothetical protein [Polyangiaceae bacterium]
MPVSVPASCRTFSSAWRVSFSPKPIPRSAAKSWVQSFDLPDGLASRGFEPGFFGFCDRHAGELAHDRP